ncbi:MAG: hypothetical protein WBA87_07570 [Microbacterium sp.]
MKFIRGFGRFWYDFLIGDDWKIAASVVLTLGLATIVLLTANPPEQWLTAIVGAALLVAFALAIRIDVGRGD